MTSYRPVGYEQEWGKLSSPANILVPAFGKAIDTAINLRIKQRTSLVVIPGV